jgi:hypothetical protein
MASRPPPRRPPPERDDFPIAPAAAEFTLAGRLDCIQCPTLLCAAADDPLSGTATTVYDGLTASKTLLHFTRTDGASDHCEMRNRALFNLRSFSWLDETLHKQ